MNETQTATPPEQGATTETVVQETQTPSQEVSTPQESGTAQVDSGAQQPTASKGTERPQGSDFYRKRERERRERTETAQRISNLERELAHTRELLKNPPTAASATPKKKIEIWENPEQWAADVKREVLEDFLKQKEAILKEEVPNFLKSQKQSEQKERNTQAALERIFPKTNQFPHATWEERADANPERMEAVRRALDEYGLESVSATDPIKAANAVIRILDGDTSKTKEQPRNPLAPSKAQMASTATNNGKGGAKMTQSLQEVHSQLEKLTNQLGENSRLNQDEKFMKELRTARETYIKLAQTENSQK